MCGGVNGPALRPGGDHHGHVAAAAGGQLHVVGLEAEAARVVHQVVPGLAPAHTLPAVVGRSEAVTHFMAEGESCHAL